MDIRKVTDSFAVSPQIAEADIPTLVEAGFATIVCNRPDHEEPGQPDVLSIEKAARDAGLAFHHLPITSGMFGPQHIEQMRDLIDSSDGPVFAYCRSGTRSVMLWAFQEIGKRPRDEVLRDAAAAGYDLSQQL